MAWNEKTEAAKRRKEIKVALKNVAEAVKNIGNACELAYILKHLQETHGVAK